MTVISNSTREFNAIIQSIAAFWVLAPLILSPAVVLAAQQPVVPRVYFHGRLEPIGNKTIHGMGETNTPDYQSYTNALPNTPPAIFMVWTSIEADLGAFSANLKKQLDSFGSQVVIPQVGLEFTGDSSAVRSRAFMTSSLQDLFKGLQALGRPVYLRVGIEPNANGLWNNYPPADYIAAFQHITNMIRSYPLPEVATVLAIHAHAASWNFYAVVSRGRVCGLVGN